MDRSAVCDQFIDTLEIDLYPFQEEALLSWFESDSGVLVSAPTGMGKTLVAEAAIFESLHTGRRLYYTTPLIALTDQKFREFQERVESWGFPRDRVGLITGNRRVNPDATVRVVVAEILLNHVLAGEAGDAAAVVMDEFHYFNDPERGIVWELTLLLLPATVRLMLLSATVGNALEFVHWLNAQHGRHLRLVRSNDRRVPLEFVWVPDQLLTELLPRLVSADDGQNRSPALVFCFNRDECWEVAERLKGTSLISPATRSQIEQHMDGHDFGDGIGPKLRQMLIRGVGVHHAGILPKHKEIIERLFLAKLVPFVVCTETLAAGVNLPARSVVISTLVKGPKDHKKLIPASAAHQMFGRAGRPQFDDRGYIYALAHDDDVKIWKWKQKMDQLDRGSKDPGILRARKQLERKKPSRRKTVTYWTEGQFQTLIQAGPAKLYSQSMIPYPVLIFLLTKTGRLAETRELLRTRFNTPPRLEKFQQELDFMIQNLQGFGYLTVSEDGHRVVLDPRVHGLLRFRSVNPLFAAFSAEQLRYASFTEKLQTLEAALPLPPALRRKIQPPYELEPGPLQRDVLLPRLLQMGLVVLDDGGRPVSPLVPEDPTYYDDEPRRYPLSLPELLKLLFDATASSPESIQVQSQWIAGGVFDSADDFYEYVGNRELVKNEGLILRHLLRLVILAGEFQTFSGDDPDYTRICEKTTTICTQVDPRYTDHFLAEHRAEDML